MNLIKGIKTTVVSAGDVAGTTALTSSVLDMNGFDGVMWIALTGDVTSGSVLTLTAKQNTANSTSSPTPTALTNGAATYTSASSTDADNKVLIVDVYRPTNEYQFCVLTRTTQNAVIAGIIAIQYQAHLKPTTQDATAIATALAIGS